MVIFRTPSAPPFPTKISYFPCILSLPKGTQAKFPPLSLPARQSSLTQVFLRRNAKLRLAGAIAVAAAGACRRGQSKFLPAGSQSYFRLSCLPTGRWCLRLRSDAPNGSAIWGRISPKTIWRRNTSSRWKIIFS